MPEPDCFLRYRISHHAMRNLTLGKSNIYVLVAAARRGFKMVLRPTAAATCGFTMVSFTEALRCRNTFVGGTSAPPSALLGWYLFTNFASLLPILVIDFRYIALYFRLYNICFSVFLWRRDVCVIQWVCSQRISVRIVQCCVHLGQCNLTRSHKTVHLHCADFMETRPFTSNEAVV